MNGTRIRQARLLAGMSQQDVADALGRAEITANKASVSGFERGEDSPSASILMALSRLFRVPPAWLTYEPHLEVDWQAYRKRSTLPAKTREAIESFARDVAELQIELCEQLFPDTKVSFPERMNVTSVDDAEEAARALRKEWGLGNEPIASLTESAEANGVIVIEWDRPTDRFDALSGWCGENVPVIVVKAGVDLDRKRFNLAHELGHLVMNTPDEMPDKESEKLANRFAGALLVPQEAAIRELGVQRNSTSFAELGALKRRYGLSMQGWVFRGKDLGIFSPGLARSFWLEVSRRGWRKSEPFSLIVDEKPDRLEGLILSAKEGNLVSDERVLQALPDFEFAESVSESDTFPTATELMAMPREDREYWTRRSFALAKDMDFEIFEAFGEEEF